MTEPSEISQLDMNLWRVPLRTPTLPPATRTNTYVLGGRRLLVVDPAPSNAEEQATLLTSLQDLERTEGRKVTGVVLTHHHGDHGGAARLLQEELGVPVLAHAETAARVEVPVDWALEDDEPLPVDGPTWRSVFTPGHAAGHLCFVRDDDHAVIAGDMVAGVGTILVDPDEGSMRLYLQSLERLLSLHPSVLYPSHGFELRPGAETLQMYLAHRRMRSEAVLQRVLDGDRLPEEMVPHIYVGTPPEAFGLAARSVLSMLIQHEEEGRVRRDGDRWEPTPGWRATT